MATRTVMDWERVLRFVDGKFDRLLEPGRHKYSRRRVRMISVDTRSELIHVNGQEVITEDGVSIKVSVTGTWRVSDPIAFTMDAQEPRKLLYTAIQDAVRDRIASLELEAMLGDRAAMSAGIAEEVGESVAAIGIAVESMQVRDLMLPGELRNAAMDVVTARAHGRASLEAARAEAAALRSLKNTASLLEEHPVLLKLRTLQLAGEAGTTLVLDPRDAADGGR